MIEATKRDNKETIAIVKKAIEKIVTKIARLNGYLKKMQRQVKIDKTIDKTKKKV